MADYSLPSVVEKRVRFFDGQFLQDQDFVDEQNYQLDREHRHNRLLHGAGIAEGLTVSATQPNQVTVAPGTAIDDDGHQLVLAEATSVDLPGGSFNDKPGIELYLSYLESAEDPQTVAGSADFTRWLERPQLTALAPGDTYSGTSPPVLLAKLTLDHAGRVTVDTTVCTYAGARLPGPSADAASLRATAAGSVDLAGSLTVDGNVGVGTASPKAKLEVAGGGGMSVDLLVNGRLRSNNNDGGLWVASDRFVGGLDTNKIGFFNTAWRVAVLNNGYVGIGTTAPSAMLTVNGDLTFTAAPTTIRADGGRLHITGGEILYLLNKSGVIIGKEWGGTGGLTVEGDLHTGGNVGIGTTSPKAKLEVAGGGAMSIDLLVNGRLQSNNDDGGLWVASDRFVGGFDTNKIGFFNTAWRVAVLNNGYVGIGTTAPSAMLTVNGDLTFTAAPTTIRADGGRLHITGGEILYLLNKSGVIIGKEWGGTGGLTVEGDLHTGGNVGIGGTLTVGTVAAPGTAPVQFTSPVVVPNVQSTNLNQYSMYPMSGAQIHQDIFDAVASGAIVKLGSPAYNDTTYTSSNLWYARRIISFGGNNEQDGNGAQVTIPAGFDTLWIRVLGDRWNVVHAYVAGVADLGLWAGGHHDGNSYCPDGSLSDGWNPPQNTPVNTVHQWLPIYVGFSDVPRSIALVPKTGTDQAFWLSGVAFTVNPWAHARQSAVAFLWGLNGGDKISGGDMWGSDVRCYPPAQTVMTFMVPFVKSGRDKLLYVIGVNDGTNHMAHDGVLVNGTYVGRLRASFDNPFARHWNSKMYERYAAVIVPASLIKSSGFGRVQIDMRHQDDFQFREVGTHDLEVPI